VQIILIIWNEFSLAAFSEASRQHHPQKAL